ncbi:hypothetical protein REPUB_Repub05bG0185900 [Reevesia pubescens]
MAMATCLLFLFIAASAFSTLNADVSIDCGSSEIYSDEYFIGWVGDENYIQHGESVELQSSNSVYRPMRTLRVFDTERKKNCYSIVTDKGTKVLVRASFFYGNYDGKSTPPSFDLQFNGNHWVTVETSSDEIVYYEAIYVNKMDTVSVCVAQTSPNMFPFISAIEVVNLDSKMYGGLDTNHALMLRRRVAYGSKEIIRSSDDIYDRIWVPAINGGDFTVLTNDEFVVDVSLDDYPPKAVFQNAFTTNRTSISISLGTNLPTTKVPIYMNMYFVEVSELGSTEKRSFELYVDGKSSSDPFIPSYEKAGQMSLTNFTASSNTTFSLVASSDSTLPPLINALEVFTISDELTDGTNSDDVEGLVSLQNEFNVLDDTFMGLDQLHICLHTPSNSIVSFLPDFSSMTALEIIDLHNNSLLGSIPEFLGTLPNLKQLNLADNEFRNPDLCVSGKSCKTATADPSGNSPAFSSRSSKKKSNLPVIFGTTIPIFVLLWVIGGFFAVLHHKRKSAAIAAGQGGGANRPNGMPPQAAKMQMTANNNIAQNLVNDYTVNIQEQEGQQSAEEPLNQNDQQDRQGGY